MTAVQTYANCKITIIGTDPKLTNKVNQNPQKYYSQSLCEALNKQDAGIHLTGAYMLSVEGVAVSTVNFRLYDRKLFKNKNLLLVSQETINSPAIISHSIDKALDISLSGAFNTINHSFIDSLNIQRKAYQAKN